MFEDYINQVAPASVKVKVTPKHGGQGYVCPIDLPAYQAAERLARLLLARNRWQYVAEEVFLSSPPLSKY